MSDPKQKFYLTTPIYYVNARPHIGHAYTTIVADVLARRHRLLGEDTFFLTGTDEHGQKIERSAAAAGIPPQQFADQVSKSFEDLWKRMGITNDDYIRTTDPKHAKGVQKLFTTLYKKGFIYLDSYTGAYCVSDETFVDVNAGEPCPDCGRITEIVTEENFFFKLSAFQLPLLNLIESGELKIENDSRRNEVISFLRGSVQSIVREYWDKKLNAATTEQKIAMGFAAEEQSIVTVGSLTAEQWEQAIEDAVQRGVLCRTAKRNAYLPGALKDLSVSRSSFTWGIPVPEPAASAAKEKHVIYVWLDALANYMTAIGYGSDDPNEQKKFDHYWPADLHLVGKEIIRFHCVYWPAFLLAADLPLPKAITAHGWLLFDNSKMSKSKGNIVRTETILDAFGDHVYGKQFPDSNKPERDLFASDILRYFLLREIPFGQDGSFSFDALITRYNADLANGYGNLVSRTLSMIAKRGGVISEDKLAALDPNFMSNDVLSYITIAKTSKEAEADLDQLSFTSASAKIASLVTLVDGYMTQYTPWKLVGSQDPIDQYKAEFILYSAAEAIRIITALLYPILPYATAKVWQQLGLGDIETAAKNGELKTLTWGGLQPGTKLGPLSPIFPRADKSLAETMINMENPETPRPESPLKSASTPTPAQPVTTDRLDPSAPPRNFTEATHVAGSAAHSTHNGPTPSHTEATPSAPFNTPAAQAPGNATPADASPQITIDDFIKIDLRVAQIVVAERIPKADKLLRLEVDLGYEKRQILSGIAEFYTPEELIGRRIVVIANLAPRKMRGLESHGMLLAASHGENGKPILATFGEDIALGSRLK
jgi:methionyl-tRNA synthetase